MTEKFPKLLKKSLILNLNAKNLDMQGVLTSSEKIVKIKVKSKTYIGVQRFVGDAKQTLEIRVERRRNRQGGGCLHFSCTYTIILKKSGHVR